METETTPREKTAREKLEVEFQGQVKRATGMLEFIHTNRDKLEKLDLRFSGYSNYVDFDHLQRPDVLRVIKTFPGKWNKRAGYDGGLIYELETPVTGFIVRVYNGEPPPSCKIVETVKYVHVKAHKERVVTRTVVCK